MRANLPTIVVIALLLIIPVSAASAPAACPPSKKAWDVAISFIIITAILGLVFWLVSSF